MKASRSHSATVAMNPSGAGAATSIHPAGR